jgi:carboxylesterase type B
VDIPLFLSSTMARLKALLAILVAAAGFGSSLAQSTVITRNGTITGVASHRPNVEKFLGIPYAEPPFGDLRLRQATPLQSSFGRLDASTFGHSCYGPYGSSQPNASEDCLTLNIWRPANISSGSNVPVLVWFYGGGLTRGYTSNPLFEGTNFVSTSLTIGKPIILVTVNYRLSSLGFLNGRQMAELGLLNIGMKDQRVALHWIQENIGAFGGDKAKVTLFGESAGAVSIYSHLVSYGGQDAGLYRGAILQSGGAFPLTYPNATAFQKTFDGLVVNTTCSRVANATSEELLDCIRALPIEEFRKSVGTSTGQSIDGDFTPTSIQFAFPEGRYVKVATLVGTNTDEGTTSAPKGINTTEDLLTALAPGFGRPIPLPDNITQPLVSLYSQDPSQGCPYHTGAHIFTIGTLDKQACSVFGDLVQIAPARMIARSLSVNNAPDKAVYRYRFNHVSHNVSTEGVKEGISTGNEQAYVFSNQISTWPWDTSLAFEMSSAWISFAHDLDPNFGGST